MSHLSQRGSAIAALAATVFALGCDADFSPPTTQIIDTALLPEPVRQTLETQFQSVSLAKVERRRRSGRDLYLAFGTGTDQGDRILLDSRGMVLGRLHGEDGAPGNAYGFRPFSGNERLAGGAFACPARIQ
ncbi:MAG: hypothetical protein JWR22_2694 [Herminiimonas sp.]|nr:hypothetical protein [Herminiimonas sp.]